MIGAAAYRIKLYFYAFTYMAESFAQKTVWVTGASSGIGEELCRQLDRAGARLILSSRNRQELERVRGELRGTDHIILPLDLADSASFDEKVKEAVNAVGRVDIIVHNGGVSQRSLVLETTLDVDRRLFDINFFGAVGLTKALLPQMLKQGGGHIVVVSSVTGVYGTPYRSGYAASKHALHGFFDSLRAELHDKQVDVTLICPGFVHTNITRHALTGDGSALNQMDRGTSGGLPVDYFVRRMLRAMARRKRQAHIGGRKEMFGIFMKRFFPGLFARFITKVNVR